MQEMYRKVADKAAFEAHTRKKHETAEKYITPRILLPVSTG
ncbi:hypothetical protein J2S09_003149 [Bacillus fengqiuensis]|nr:hypothetical protein [Bacillus fengqiuensis]